MELKIVFSTTIPPLFNGSEVLPSFSGNANLFAEIAFENYNFIFAFDCSKVSDLNCLPVMVLKKCEPGLSYTLAEGIFSGFRSFNITVVTRTVVVATTQLVSFDLLNTSDGLDLKMDGFSLEKNSLSKIL